MARKAFLLTHDSTKKIIPKETIENKRLDETIDIIRRRYGFASIVHASSYMDGATSLKRASLVGGHAGGMDGINQ